MPYANMNHSFRTTGLRLIGRSVLRFFFSVALFSAITSLAHAQPQQRSMRVEMEVLGSVPGAHWTIPLAINNRGEVAGMASVGSEDVAFVWTREGGFQVIAENAFASDINERGDVVGQRCVSASDNCVPSGFLWNANTGFEDLGSFFPAVINNRADMAGSCISADGGHIISCAIRRGVVERFECAGICVSWATGINARGDVVGITSSFSEGADFAMLWPARGGEIVLGTGTADDISNHGAILGRTLEAVPVLWTGNGLLSASGPITALTRAMNTRSWAIGVTYPDRPARAFLWDAKKGHAVILSQNASEALDINDRGDVVGTIGDGTLGEVLQAALWRVRP